MNTATSKTIADLAAAGVRLALTPDGKIHATGPLTDTTRQAIRDNRDAIAAELAAASMPAPVGTCPSCGEQFPVTEGPDEGRPAWSCPVCWRQDIAAPLRVPGETLVTWEKLPPCLN